MTSYFYNNHILMTSYMTSHTQQRWEWKHRRKEGGTWQKNGIQLYHQEMFPELWVTHLETEGKYVVENDWCKS